MGDIEKAKGAAGYQYRGDNEFIFGFDDQQEIFDHLPGIYAKDVRLARRGSKVKHKNATIRAELEGCMGRPIADTDKDFSGRTPHWGDKFLAGKMIGRIPAAPTVKEPELLDITADCKPENKRSSSGGTYIRMVYHFPDYPNKEALAATIGVDGIKAEKWFVIKTFGERSFRIFRNMDVRPWNKK